MVLVMEQLPGAKVRYEVRVYYVGRDGVSRSQEFCRGTWSGCNKMLDRALRYFPGLDASVAQQAIPNN